MQRKKILRRLGIALLVLLVVALAVVIRPGYLWLNAWFHDLPVVEQLARGFTDDASRLNKTHVKEVWRVPADPDAAETQLRELLARARTEGLRVAIAGARHSMGGHTIYPDGIVVDMLAFNHIALDASSGILRVGAGARWSQVIAYLDARGFSVGVMQSNDNFSVGGSLSVNCHGWQHDRQPICSTVESVRVMKADGSIMRCSQAENSELFSLVLGGYGLFGVILDVELRVVPNERYRAESQVIAAERYVDRFRERVRGRSDIGMVYGRLSVVPGEKTFLSEAIQTVFRRAPCEPEEIPRLADSGLSIVRREVFRAQIGSKGGKEVRWQAEKTIGEQVASRYVSRNQLLNEGAEIYQERNADRTDILQEYFIPPEYLALFLQKAATIIPRHQVDLLNVTVRNILEDRITFLRYADQEMFALVMLFNLPRSREGDASIELAAKELIDAALACNGRYYLTYRLHATAAQFARAYPQGAEFFDRKRFYDPAELFQNQFYLKYGKN
jgi:FAD/FMN-containing dehydrogenase